MKTYPLVSVIVPTKNEENNIKRCLTSIQKQNYQGEIEVIVVDNHSSDKTVAVAKPFASKVIIAGDERSKQRNIGARKAKGRWLLFVDADMELSEHVVKECVSLTRKHMAFPIVVVNEKAVGRTFLGKAFALEKNCYQYATWLHAARFFPKYHFLKLGGYDTVLIAGEDWDLTQRFRLEGFPLFITKKSHLIHHERDDNLITIYKKELYYINNIHRYAKKHPLAFSYQGSYLYRAFIWIRSWDILLRHPILTATFLGYKFSVWILWMLHGKKDFT